jgi:hypothetical protein
MKQLEPDNGRRPRLAAACTLLLCSVLLVACSGSPSPKSSQARVAERDESVDFSGSWEMDYGRSDNVDDRLRSIYNELQRQAERRARGRGEVSNRGTLSMGTPEGQSMSAIVALARLADYITTSQVLTIEQSEIDITVEREDNFALGCTFIDDTPEPVINELGSELCGWDAHQLVFLISMPDGLRVNHRMTLAPDGQKLHIATSVSNGGNAHPFTLSRVYYRFNPLPPDYACKYTLSKGNVCSREGS